MTHTPGPWSIDHEEGENYAYINAENYAYEDASGWFGLARVVVRFDGRREDDAKGLANARLIAAAPDLLAALQRLMDLIELSGPRRIAPNKSPIEAVRATLSKAEYEAARAAIAKAEGRS